MTKPDWCPADVWEASRKVSDDLNETEWHTTYSHDTAIIARAILAERERALEEAVHVAARWLHTQSSIDLAAVEECSAGVRDAIRALKETP